MTVEMTAADDDGNGLVRTQVLEITGGSDLAENFNINAGDHGPEPGMLLVHLPDEQTTRAMVLLAPRQLSEPQRETVKLLVG